MSKYKVLSDTPDYRIVYHPAENKSEKLVITFSTRAEKIGFSGFGTQDAVSLGYDTIFVSSHHKLMHRNLDIDTLEAIVSKVAAGRDIVAFGADTGAYAALYYGGKLNAKILAFSPRLPVHPYLSSKTDDSYRNLKHVVDLKDVALSDHRPVVVYDPLEDMDAKFFEEWVSPAYPDATVYLTPMAGHNVIGQMKDSGTYDLAIAELLKGKRPKTMPVWERGHYNHHYEKGFLAARNGSDKKAIYHFKAALKLCEKLHIFYALTRSARQVGDADLEARTKLATYHYKKSRHARMRATKKA